MDLELRRPPSNDIQARQQQALPINIPLGTAEWHKFADDALPTFQQGDIFVGTTMNGHPLGVMDDGHVGIVAKTRSGKGAGFIVPNIVLWPGSIVVIDPKGENAILTARRRGNGTP